MEKIVKNGERITTVTLDGTECAVKFSSKYRGFEIKNESGGDITVSLEQGIAEGDGVVTVKNGESINYMHSRMLDTVYITGTGKVLAAAKNDGTPVFPVKAKGGDEHDSILARAVFRLSWKNGYSMSTYDFNTQVPQSLFEENGMTVVFKFNASAWNNYYGLMGYHEGNKGYMIQYDDSTNFIICLPKVLIQIDAGIMKGFVGQDIVFIASDNRGDPFVLINGEKVECEFTVESRAPFGDLTLFKSYNIYGGERCFHGIMYDAIIFAEDLNVQEAIQVTHELNNTNITNEEGKAENG